ncbi:MAG: hydrolase [Methanomassiliicoccales archaeon]|jgi:nicotinamidase-related amidase
MTAELIINKNSTALVVIDLQKGIAANPDLRPHSSQEVITNAAKLANAFRKSNMPVFLVHVIGTKETALKVISDVTFSRPTPPSDWTEFVPELAPMPTDVVITKRQWGAFYGTELDLQLRRRGVDTIVLCGIATDYGVESTARFAYEYGYQQIFVEDAMASRSDEQHNAAVNFIFKRIGRVRRTEEVENALDCICPITQAVQG